MSDSCGTANQRDKEHDGTEEVRTKGLEGGYDPEILKKKLTIAIVNDDIKKFQQLLRSIDVSKRKPLLEEEHSPNYVHLVNGSLFQFACLYPNRPQFIGECISAGCDVNKTNSEGRHPISYIFESFSQVNLAVLLDNPCTDVDCIVYPASTPINFIISTMRDCDNDFQKRYACLKLLIEHCADVNIPDLNGVTPIQNVLQNENLKEESKKAILQCYFDVSKGIDIDGMRDELKEFMPNLELPPIRNKDTRKWNFNRAIECIKSDNEDEFIYEINRLAANQENRTLDLLQVKHLLTYIVTVKHWHFSLERVFRILKDNKLNFKRIDSALGGENWFYNMISNPDVKLCFDLIMRLPNINKDINDPFAHILPPLEGVPPNRSDLILKFLEHGVHIESLYKIDPSVLEKHFDRCITSNGKHLDDPKLLVTYDYTNLISRDSADSLSIIASMLTMSQFRHLLGHPLIASFLYLKWIKWSPIFYMNFLLTLFFTLTTIPYILTCFLKHTNNPILFGFTAFFTFLVIIRELSQFLVSPCKYLSSFDNYMEWPMIAIISFILSDIEVGEWRGKIAATSVILITYEMFILVRLLPLRMFSTHFIMLETVTKNFFKFFLLFSFIVFAFAISFYAAFYEQNLNSTQNGTASNCTYNSFGSIGLSVLKTVVMFTGELDTSSIEFQTSTSYLIFVSFIFLVTTVLANLLVGLAVSDISEIRSQVALTHSIRRCHFLIRYGNTNQHKNTSRMISFQSNFEAFPENQLKYEYQIQPHAEQNVRQWLRNVFTLNFHPKMEKEILAESVERIELQEKTGKEVDPLREEVMERFDSIEECNDLFRGKLIQIEQNHDSIRMMVQQIIDRLK